MTREDIDLIRFKFKDWLALSVEERAKKNLPLHLTGFAQNHGITRRSLTNWQNEFEEDRIVEDGTEAEKEAFLEKIKPFALSGKNSRYADLYMKGRGWLVEKREVKQQFELTVADQQQIHEQWFEGLRREAKTTGICPVCLKREALCNQPRLDTKPKHKGNHKVESLAVSVRPA